MLTRLKTTTVLHVSHYWYNDLCWFITTFHLFAFVIFTSPLFSQALWQSPSEPSPSQWGMSSLMNIHELPATTLQKINSRPARAAAARFASRFTARPYQRLLSIFDTAWQRPALPPVAACGSSPLCRGSVQNQEISFNVRQPLKSPKVLSTNHCSCNSVSVGIRTLR